MEKKNGEKKMDKLIMLLNKNASLSDDYQGIKMKNNRQELYEEYHIS